MAKKQKNNMRDLINEACGRVPKSYKDDEGNPQEEGLQVNPGKQEAGRNSDTASSTGDAVEPVLAPSAGSAPTSAKVVASDPASENDAAPTAEDSEGQTSPAWDFLMSHCNSFDPSDKGVSVRIDRKVKKRLDLAKARMSETVSMKGMVSAIVLHFLTEHEAMFKQQQQLQEMS